MEVIEGLAEEGADDILGPDSAEGEGLLLGREGRRLVILLIQLDGLELFISAAGVVLVIQGSAEDEGLDASGGV